MNWARFRETLKVRRESDVHPHVAEEKATYFRSMAFESTEIEYLDLLFALVKATKPVSLLETGSYHGVSSVCMALAIKENELDGAPVCAIISIERDIENIRKAAALAEEWSVRQYITFVQGDASGFLLSHSFASQLDMVFLDSTRTKRVEEFEILRQRNLLKSEAFIVFHDTSALRAKSIPDQGESQSFYLAELRKVALFCEGPIVFSLSRGLHLFQYSPSRLAEWSRNNSRPKAEAEQSLESRTITK